MRALARNLFDFEAPETLGGHVFFRLFEVFVVAYTIMFCWEWGLYIQQIETVLLPLGMAQYIDISFMFDHGISILSAALVTLFCMLGLTRTWRYAYLAALVLFHFQYVARYCLGEISHGSNFIGMSLLALALGAVFFAGGGQRHRFVMGTVYFFFGLGYTSAALCKLIASGLSWPLGQHLWLWIAERQVDTLSKFGTFDPNWLQQLVLDDARIGTLVLSFGLLVELFGFLLWFRRTRPFILVALIGMHVGVALSMNILFDAFIYQLTLLTLPWETAVNYLTARLGLKDRLEGLQAARVF